MFRSIKKITPVAFSVLITGVCGSPALAQTEPSQIINQIQEYTQEGREDSINQITNVNQLKDVSPTDWSYEALRSLSDRYGCISGLPDGTYQGDRPITRNEFAAGLNSCFQQIERSLNSQKQTSSNWYLDGKRFIPEANLATLGGRLDKLKSRTIQLENNQFSPTTKLTGESIFGISNQF